MPITFIKPKKKIPILKHGGQPVTKTGHTFEEAFHGVKKDFFALISLGEKPNLVALATKWGFHPQSVRNRAAREKWWGEAKENYNFTATPFIEITEQLWMEVRSNHLEMARALQEKAEEWLATVDGSKLQAKDAIALMKLGLEEERKALGMPEMYVAKPKEVVQNKEQDHLTDQLQDHREVQRVGAMIMQALTAENQVIEDAQFTERRKA